MGSHSGLRRTSLLLVGGHALPQTVSVSVRGIGQPHHSRGVGEGTGYPLPLEKPLPVSAEGADAAVGAFGGAQEGIAPEQLRDGTFVVGEVVVESNAGRQS